MTGQIALTGRAGRKNRAPRLVQWVAAAVSFMFVVGCIHLILSVTSEQEALSRDAVWLRKASELRRLLDDLADEADAGADADPRSFLELVPANVKREAHDRTLGRTIPLEGAEGESAAEDWMRGALPLATAFDWLVTGDADRPVVLADPARDLSRTVSAVLPRVAAQLTTRSEYLGGQRGWLYAAAAIIALGACLLLVTNLRLRHGRDALVASTEALRENEDRYRQMFEKNNAIKLLVSPEDGRIVDANHAACAFYGGDLNRLREMSLQEIGPSTEQAAHELALMSRAKRKTTLLTEHRLVNGECRDVEMHVSPLTIRGMRLLYVILHDATERRRMEKEAQRASELESLGVLAGGIAHDFNNLLAGMIGNLQIARLDVPNDTPVWEALAAAETASRSAQGLAQQLLTFAKGGAPVRRSASLDQLIRDTVSFALRGSAASHSVHVAPDLAHAVVDEGQINQVLHNLTLNANQAMPNGGEIRVEARNMEITEENGLRLAPGRFVQISVADTGMGIPDEQLPRIFEPYFTTKESGSGLGLATAYSIVKRHDGLLTVESEPGRGTTFHIYLPASDESPAAAPTEVSTGALGGERILWMDDDKIVGEVARRMLMRFGYQIEIVADGRACLERYAAEKEGTTPFDLVVLDLTVPGGMGGRETIKRLLELDPGVKAVVTSGYSDNEVLADHLRHGFVGVLRKPFTRQDVAGVLIEVFDQPEG